jgi:hypothetical protein
MDIGSEASGLANLIAPVLKPLATGLEFFGVGVILIGVAVATAGYVRDLLSSGQRDAYAMAPIGRGILLVLEILIGADARIDSSIPQGVPPGPSPNSFLRDGLSASVNDAV